MSTASAISKAIAPATAFPRAQVEKLLREELTEKHEEAQLITGDWEPSIDSLELVSVVLSIEKLLECRIRPEDVIQCGGYKSVDEGINDMLAKVESRWSKNNPGG